jgi:hypothetical protein
MMQASGVAGDFRTLNQGEKQWIPKLLKEEKILN